MLKKSLVALTLLAAFSAQAQNTAPPAASGAKKELAARIVRAQQGAIDGLARQLAERPAVEIMGGAMQVIGQRVPREKQEAVAKEVEAELQKYANEAVPIVQKRATAIAPETIGSVLEEKFSEDELRAIAAALENPALIKFQRALPELQNALGERLIADTRGQIEPKVQALEQTVSKRLGLPAQGNGAAPAQQQPASRPRR